MAFPARPSQNQDPWYQARETYDNALEAGINSALKHKGTFSGSLNAVTFEDQGTYSIRSPFPTFMPFGVSNNLSTPALLEIVWGGWGGEVVQRITDDKGTTWRKSRGYQSGQPLTWFDWNIHPNHHSRNFIYTNHLDTVWGPEWAGSWNIPPHSTNIPGGFPWDRAWQRTVLEVVDSGNIQGQIQRVTDQWGYAWRKSSVSGASEPVWGPWHFNRRFQQGTLNNDWDLNTMVGPEYAGSWNIAAGEMGTVPSNFPWRPRQRTFLEVVDGGNGQAQTQTVTDQWGSAWRKTTLNSTYQNPLWGPWHFDSDSLSGGVRFLEMNGSGDVVFSVGDPHAIMNHTIASMGKMLTGITMFDLIGTSLTVLNRKDVEVKTEDFSAVHNRTSNLIQAGDVLSLYELLLLSMMPSDNVAPSVIARHVGSTATRLRSGTSDWQNFVDHMNRVIVAKGWQGAYAENPVGSVYMSPYQVADMLRVAWTGTGASMNAALSLKTRDITTAGSNARTFTITSLVHNALSWFPRVLGGKGGNVLSRSHTAFAWSKGTNNNAYTVVMDVDMDRQDRYIEAMKIIRMSDNGFYPGPSSGNTGDPYEIVSLSPAAVINNLRDTAEYLLEKGSTYNTGISAVDSSNRPGLLRVTGADQVVGNPFSSVKALVVQEIFIASAHYFRTYDAAANNWSRWAETTTRLI